MQFLPPHEQAHDHDHGDGAVPHTHLTSVGIDIGSSTSHLMFSQLTVGYPSPHQRHPEVLERQVIARSRVMLTPFARNWEIEAGPLGDLISQAFREASLDPASVDTGAVIVTGELARRDNAQRIVELFANQTGRFVCATAGPRLEAILAAHGSGAVAMSRERTGPLLHVDVGGGTTKINLIAEGTVLATTAVNVGARLVAVDADDHLIRIERAGARFLEDVRLERRMSNALGPEDRQVLARRMARVLFDVLGGREAPWPDFFVSKPIALPEGTGQILFSGGVSEYVYARETRAFGDLGPDLGSALRAEAGDRGYELLEAPEGIRATVIGASEFSIQMSGETIFVPDTGQLPMRNLRTFVVPVTWAGSVAEQVEEGVRRAIEERDPEVVADRFALLISTPPFRGYAAAHDIAAGVNQALATLDPAEWPTLMVFEHNYGRLIGGMLSPSIPCIDEVRLSELDFIDVGEMVPGESYVPVVVKSLAFGV